MELYADDIAKLGKLSSLAGELLDAGEELPRQPLVTLTHPRFDAVASWDKDGHVVVKITKP